MAMRTLSSTLLAVLMAVASPLTFGQGINAEQDAKKSASSVSDDAGTAEPTRDLRDAGGAGREAPVQKWKLNNAMPMKFVGPEPKSDQPQ